MFSYRPYNHIPNIDRNMDNKCYFNEVSGRNDGLLLDNKEKASEGNGNTFQYSCLENPLDRGVWQLQATQLQRVGSPEWLTHTLTKKKWPFLKSSKEIG